MFVLVGGDELLLDDAVRVARNGERDGVEVRLVVGEGMQHDYPLTLPWLPESRAAFTELVGFVEGLGTRA